MQIRAFYAQGGFTLLQQYAQFMPSGKNKRLYAVMKLNRYLVENGVSQKDFANRLGVCQATIHKYLYKNTIPSGKRMMQIHKITQGAVSVEDWMELHDIGDAVGQS